MKHFWNERYRNHDSVYGIEPNEFFKQQLDILAPGRLLLPGEGEGRNALYAAARGWSVTAIDYSEAAQQKAMMRASEQNLSIDYQVEDIVSFEPREQFDVIALIYVHLPPQVRAAFHTRLKNALKPGGTLILEAFHKQQLRNSSGGPSELSMLYDAETLLQDFEDLSMVHCAAHTVELAEGIFHNGRADVIRLVVRKDTL
jgi:2-polyprenyl-3-methyl-5-hydroxy-6-metoxy-1,4-benzoquinol methylase